MANIGPKPPKPGKPSGGNKLPKPGAMALAGNIGSQPPKPKKTAKGKGLKLPKPGKKTA